MNRDISIDRLRPSSEQPQAVSPWQDVPTSRRYVGLRFSPEVHPAETDVEIPASLSRAATKRLAEFVAGRRCAREALHLLTGHAVSPGMAEDRSPLWPSGIVGSISHAGDQAIAVVGDAGRYLGLGIDLEKPLGETEAQEIAPSILTDKERRIFGDTVDAFTVCLAFSAKESLYKALYPLVRRQFFFEAAELVEWRADGQARLRLAETLTADWPAGTEISARFCQFQGYLLTEVAIGHPSVR